MYTKNGAGKLFNLAHSISPFEQEEVVTRDSVLAPSLAYSLQPKNSTSIYTRTTQ